MSLKAAYTGGARAIASRSMTGLARTRVTPNMLTAVTGVWHTGADRNFTLETEGQHPFRKHLSTLHIGDAIRSGLRAGVVGDQRVAVREGHHGGERRAALAHLALFHAKFDEHYPGGAFAASCLSGDEIVSRVLAWLGQYESEKA